MPWLGGYKSEVEANLSRQLNTSVSIDELAVRWEGFGPKLSAKGVTLNQSDDQAVTLDEVLIDVDVAQSLGQRGAAIDALTLIGANLSLVADERGHFTLQGLAANDAAGNKQTNNASSGRAPNMLAWIMDTDRVELLDATVTIESGGAIEPLQIEQLNVVAVNEGKLHQLRVDMQLPEALGETVRMGVDLVGTSDDIRNATADIHLEASNLRVDAWRRLQAESLGGLPISTTGIARLDATTQVEMWGKVANGRLQSARGQMDVRDMINVITGENILDRITTDIVFSDLPSGWQITADALEFEHNDEITAVDKVIYQYRPSLTTAWQLDARGRSLSVDLATRLALSLFDNYSDLPRAKWLAEAYPSGELNSWDASFALADGRPDFSLYSAFENLNMTSVGAMPGVSGLNGSIDMNHNIGKIKLSGTNMSLNIPTAYRAPLPLESINGDLDVDFSDPVRTNVKGSVVINDDKFASDTRLEVNLEPNVSPHLYVQSSFSMGDLGQATKYIPLRFFRAPTSRWLEQALVSGEGQNGELLLFGNLSEFPFRNNQGVFRVGMDIEDGTMKYLPTWPEAKRLSGRFELNGASVRGTASDGVVDNMRLSKLTATVEDVFNPVLNLNVTSAGSLPKLIRFANTGPLRKRLEPALGDVESTGRAQMDLAVTVPLKRAATLAAGQSQNAAASFPGMKVNGSVFLRNNTVTLGRANMTLTDVDGAVGFTESGVRMNNLQGLLFGRPVRLDGKTSGRGNARETEFTLAGPIRASNVLDNYNIPLSQFVDGESRWDVKVTVPVTAAGMSARGVRIAAVSGLVGTRLRLPEPLGKPVVRTKRMALSTVIKPDSEKRRWLIDYADDVRSVIHTDEQGMVSASVRFGGGAANDQVREGIRLDGTASEIGLDGWVRTIAEYIDGLPEGEPTPILPVSGNLKTPRFIAGVQDVGGGTLKFNTDNTYVNSVIESTWLTGSVRYPRIHWTQEQPIVARVTYANKAFFDALDTAPESEQDKAGELDPRKLPPIEARVSRVQWDSLDLKDLSIRTSPSVSGLDIDTFGFAYRSAQLIGDGYWRLRDPQNVNPDLAGEHVTKLNLTLQSNDFGATATRLGFPGALNEGDGVVSGSLIWPAPAYKPSIDNLVGEANIELNRGRILKVDPGAARLVGLFAIQTLPRRLSLDFKDLVLDGLDYETIKGTVQLANGVAHAPLVQLNGSVGVIDIAGESNLVTKQYNQRITVLPRVSAALPIIGVISGGATAGLGALFAGGFLKAIGLDFDRIGLREYELKGSWEAPELTLVPFEPRTQ